MNTAATPGQPLTEAIGHIRGPPRQGSALVIEQHLIGVLDSRTVPNNRLIGEAEAHHPVALTAAHGNAEEIGDLIHHAHPVGIGGGVTEETLLHQLRRGRHRSERLTSTNGEPYRGASMLVRQTTGPAEAPRGMAKAPDQQGEEASGENASLGP